MRYSTETFLNSFKSYVLHVYRMQSHAQQRSNYSDENSLYTTKMNLDLVKKAIQQTGEWRKSGAENCGLFIHEWKPSGHIRLSLL